MLDLKKIDYPKTHLIYLTGEEKRGDVSFACIVYGFKWVRVKTKQGVVHLMVKEPQIIKRDEI